MFGRIMRIDTIEGRVHGLLYGASIERKKIVALEHKVEELTKALEWHVGVSLKVMNLEEELINLRVAENKERGERFGKDGGQVAQQTCDAINQSVEQLDTKVDQEDKQG
jgi:hypothetical protein